MRSLGFALVGLLIALVVCSQQTQPSHVIELGGVHLIGGLRLGDYSGQGSWMHLREKKPELTFNAYAQDQGGCGAALPSLARGAVEFTLVNEEVNAWFYRFDVSCRREADGRFFVLSVPNVGAFGRPGGVLCLFAYRVGSNGFSGAVEPVPVTRSCGSGGIENCRFVFLVKTGRVVGVLMDYDTVGMNGASFPAYGAFFVDPGKTLRSAGTEPVMVRVVTTDGDVIAYVINEDWSLAHDYGINELERKDRKPNFAYGERPYILHRLWDKDELLDYQILDTSKGDFGSPTPRDQSLRRELLLRHLGKLSRRLEQETIGKRMVVFPKD